MNGFKKLVLCSAMLAASSSAMAMQAMDDESMSSTTGQDGITISIQSSNITDLDITYIDRDGLGAASTAAGAGAIVVNNLDVAISNLDIVLDAGSNASGAQLNVNISTPDDIVIGLGNSNIELASAGATGSAVSGNTAILRFDATSELRITGGLSTNIKLGNRGVGESFMTLTTATPFDISLDKLTLVTTDNGGTGDIGIGIGRLVVDDVSLNMSVNVVPDGLQIKNNGTSIGGVGLERIVLGAQVATNKSIGDVYLSGLTSTSTITIKGH